MRGTSVTNNMGCSLLNGVSIAIFGRNRHRRRRNNFENHKRDALPWNDFTGRSGPRTRGGRSINAQSREVCNRKVDVFLTYNTGTVANQIGEIYPQLPDHDTHPHNNGLDNRTQNILGGNHASPRARKQWEPCVFRGKTNGKFGIPLTSLRLSIYCCRYHQFQVLNTLLPSEHLATVIRIGFQPFMHRTGKLDASLTMAC